MSRTIDERIVEMRFDNRQFERNVQTSLSTLDKLRQGLDLDGAAKGLENLGDAAKKCNMSALSRSVETVRAKFSALEVVVFPFQHYKFGPEHGKTACVRPDDRPHQNRFSGV